LLYLQDDHFWTVNVATRAIVNITKSAATSFVDRESDATVKQKPAYGVAGWTKNDEAVILYDKFDLWKVAADGTRASRLTGGAAEQTRHRYVRVNPDDEWIDTDRPIYMSLFGLWTKRSGYARLVPGAASAEPVIWVDKGVGRLAKAKDADVFAYTAEDFDDSPDVFVAGPDLKDAKQATRTNPFQDRYAWGHSDTIEYRNERGDRLQGGLYYPAGYQAGRRYPMIVYMYERLSDDVHRYVVPDERSPYNAAAFTSLGYFVLQPDILFRPREPGLSVADCVGAAVKKVIQMGLIDPRKVGVVGHSWGGFDTTFLATHTDLFAAAVAGAPITDLVSNYGNHHWSSGIAETDHIETGQQRHGGAALGGSPRLHPQLGAVQRAQHEDAAADRGRRQRRHGVLASGCRAVQRGSTGEEGCGAARVRWRRSRPPQEAESAGLPPPHRRVVRALSQGRTGAVVDHERGQLPGSGSGAQGAEGAEGDVGDGKLSRG
jgi:hypothetical protein